MEKITTTQFIKIDRCINGGPFSKSNSDGIYCANPLISQKNYENMIITQVNNRKGYFPLLCPLLKNNLELLTTYSLI